MSAPLKNVISCPICFKTMSKPILQCKTGHSMCGNCIIENKIKTCPQCLAPLTSTRNFQLEQIIEELPKNLKTLCIFADKGCKYLISGTDKQSHESECKFRRFLCEGRTFADWKCPWTGKFSDIEEHFKTCHDSIYEYKTITSLKVSLKFEFKDVQVISFFNGQQLFYYKHKVDVNLRKVFWLFQFIGPKEEASKYYYEFEVNDGPIRKFKVTEICQSDSVDVNEILQQEKCVVMGFNAVKSFRNHNNELDVKFRIMYDKNKRSDTPK